MVDEQIFLNRKKLLESLEKPLVDEDSPNYSRHEINWIDKAIDWEDVKSNTRDFVSREERLVFLASAKSTCKGKPQLIHQTIQNIPVLRKVQKIEKATKWQNEQIITQWKFIDDRYDKRYDGQLLDTLSFDFWVYRLIESGKEYYLMSEEQLPEEYSDLRGMKIDLDDLSGISETLKINKIATIFIVKEFKSAVQVIPRDKLLEFAKEMKEKEGWDSAGFMDYIFTHPDGNIYEYSPAFNKLRVAQFLSGKYEGYPLHIMKIGPVGTGKTTEAEAIDFKFREELGILEAGTSRMKVLVPSFKEKPANLGYICNCNRVAIIDELMKMVANAMQNQKVDVNNYFGELNMLLEQKKRLVGSGNDNSTIVKSTSKVCITTNPLKGKNKLAYHLSQLDNTTLSRMLIWVQDKEETEKIYSKEGIRKGNLHFHCREHSLEPCQSCSSTVGDWNCVLGRYHNFLTIYDSCQNFLTNCNLDRVKEIFNRTLLTAKEPMKQVWRSRGLHHSVLILDGITKFRCLFKDYDSSFTSNEEDYQDLELIITKMINGWETDLEFQEWGGNF